MHVSQLAAFRAAGRHSGAAIISLAALAVLSLFLLTAQGGQPREALVLQGVSPDDLAGDGVALFVPGPAEKPKFSEANARAYAESQFGGGQAIRQIALATMVTTADSTLPRERLVWVVSYDPSAWEDPLPHTPLLSPPAYRAKYALMFIDAATGNELLTTTLSEPK